MAAVPYPHIEAPDIIRIDGVRAFNPGDPIPLDTARRLGLLDSDDAPPIIGETGVAISPGFVDGEIKVAVDDTTTAASTQTQAAAPKQGQRSTPTP